MVVTDTLPAGLSYASATAPGVTCSASGQVVTCTAPALASGASLPITITATIAPGTAAGTVTDTATVRSDTPDDRPANNTAAAGTAVTTSADLSLTKTASSSVNAGDTLTYTLAAANAGPSTATGVVITDPLPTGTSFVSASAGCTASGGTVTCTVGNLAPNAQAAPTITVKVAADTAVSSLSNTASVTSSTPDPVPGNNSGTVATTVTRSADLAVSKKAAPTTVVAGTAVTYTVTVANNGPSDAAAVVLTDPAVPGLTLRSASATVGTCTVAAAGTICQIGALAAGTSATVTIHADVDPDQATGTLTNTASATSDTPDANAGNNSGSVGISVTRSADLALTKTSDPDSITWGQPITYRLTVVNNGPSTSTGVITSDPLPEGLTFAASPDGCTTNANQTVSCDVGTLAAGDSATVAFVANTPDVNQGTVVDNTATVAADTPDPIQSNNTATAQSSTGSRADLALTKTTTTAAPQAGGTISYQLVLKNNGPSAAINAAVTDTLPDGVSFVSGTWTGGPPDGTGSGTCTATPGSGGTVTCDFPRINSGFSRTITITGSIANSAKGTSTNTATATSDTTDPSAGNNTASSTTTIRAVADVGVEFSAPTTPVTAGENVTYTLHVWNAGPSTAENVVVTGQVPPGMTPVLGSSGGACTVNAGTVTCNFGNLPNGADTTITFEATVDHDTSPGQIPGTARIGSTTPDSDLSNNSSTATITVITSADLDVAKSVDPDPLVAGGPATYTITNNGPSDAQSVTVADTLDGALTGSTVTSTVGSCTLAGQDVSCSIAALAAGQSATIRVPVTVASGAAGSVDNTAEAASTTDDPDDANNSAPISTPVTTTANLVLTKTAAPSPAVAGSAIVYTLVLLNNGPSDAANTVVSDPLPTGVTVLPGGISATDGISCTASGSTVSCLVGTLPAGASRTVVINGLVAAGTAAGTTLRNTATVSSDTPGDDDTRSSTTITPVTTSADVRVSKAPVQDPPEAGTNQSYVISVANDGPSTARGVVLTDPLPDGTTFVSATIGNATACTFSGSDIACSLGDLARGSSTTVRVTVAVPPDAGGTTLTNAATAASAPATGSPTPDPDATNNTSSVSQSIATRADLSVTKEITSGPIVAGAPVSYLVTVDNAGPSDASGVVLTDPVPAGTTLVSVSGSDDATCSPDDVPHCLWDTVPAGASRTMTVVVNVPADADPGDDVTNIATVSSASFDPDPSDDSATVTEPVTALADVSITKTLVSGTPVAGAPVSWHLVVVNDGPSVARTVVVDDAAPDGVAFTGATTPVGTCDTTVHCTLGDLAPGASVTTTVTGTLAADYAGADVANTATVAAATPDPDGDNNSYTATTDVTANADLSITKTPTADSAVAGGPIGWTLAVHNAGPSAARSVVVSDTLPAGLAGAIATSDDADCSVSGRQITCSIDSLAVGADATVAVSATVASSYTGQIISNTADVSAATPDPDGTDNSASASVDVTTSADLHVTKTGPTTAIAGEPISWTVTIANHGPSDAAAAALHDQLPDGLTSVAATGPGGACPIVDGEISCALGTITAGDSATVTVTGVLDPALPAGPMTNTAHASSNTPDPDASNDTATATTTIATAADLSLTKEFDGDVAVPGETVAWTLTVFNAGPSTATGVSVADAVPATVGDVAATVIGGDACRVDGQDITCPLGDVAPGVSVRIRVTGTLSSAASGELINTATVTATTPDPATDNNSNTSTTPTAPSADLAIGKRITSGPPVAGAPVSFEITVTNHGPSDAADVQVTDPLPVQVTAATATAQGDPDACTVTGGEVACSFAALPDGKSRTITVTGTLTQTPGEAISNTASVDAATPDPQPDNNSSTADDDVSGNADLSIEKSGLTTAVAGNTITWTITVRNAGPSDAAGVVVSDPAPGGVGNFSLTVDGSPCPGTDTCDLGTVPAGTTITLHATGTIDPGYDPGTLTNLASVSSDTADPNGTNNSARYETVVSASADLSVAKSVQPTTLVPGEPATYTVTVHNAGPSDADAVIATDPLPAGITVTNAGPATSQGSCHLTTTGTVACDLGVLSAGQDAIVTIPVTVSPAYTGTDVVNSADASSTTPDPTPDNSTSLDSPASPQAALTVTKSGPESVAAGSPIAWTVTVRNAGPSLAQAVSLHDVVPDGVDAVAVTTTQGRCTTDGNAVDCDLGTVGVGDPAAITLRITGTVDPSFEADSLINSADIDSPTPEPGSDAGRHARASTDLTTSADVSVVKVATSDAAIPGATVGWTITVANAGPSTARQVVVTDTLPDGLTDVVFDAPTGVRCTDAGACSIGDLLPGNDNAIQIAVSGTLSADYAGGSVVNRASVGSTTADPDPGNNDASSPMPVSPQADLSLTKTATPDRALPGGAVTYRLVVHNAGPSTAADVVVTDPLPKGLVDAAATWDGGDRCTVDADTVSCALDRLAAGADASVTLTATIDPAASAGEMTNTASVAAATPDPDASNNTASATVSVQAPPTSTPPTTPPTTAPTTTPTGPTTSPTSGPTSPTSGPTSQPSAPPPTSTSLTLTVGPTSETTGTPTPSPTSTGPTSPLPNTGVAAAPQITWGLALLLAGLALVLLGSRRTGRPTPKHR